MAVVTRYYIIPFEDEGSPRRGATPKYLNLFTGMTIGKAPLEDRPDGEDRIFKEDYFLIKITQEEKDFDSLDVQVDVVDVSRGGVADIATKNKLTAIGVNVSLAVSADQVENEIFSWLSNESGKTIATEPQFINNSHAAIISG